MNKVPSLEKEIPFEIHEEHQRKHFLEGEQESTTLPIPKYGLKSMKNITEETFTRRKTGSHHSFYSQDGIRNQFFY
ncbi:conserved hypothetical protein [Ricinus communis]|uniref:Uncharacterized protein n=1 Tax=Ricinus communis TaxID=3988 RepID=B9RAV2_RICCO|nr:conserved hypothetical protein [Ricinus communis]